MMPQKPLPYSDAFSSPDEYVDALLHFVTTSEHFQLLSGGVHILDFFTSEPGLFHAVFPEQWRIFLTRCEPMALLDLLLRADLDGGLPEYEYGDGVRVPGSLLEFIRSVRRLSLDRTFEAKTPKLEVLPRGVALGMRTKKVHEVTNFAGYVDRLVDDIASTGQGGGGRPITHLVDFGSGQNYLGRALASEPYNHRVVAVEGRENNIAGAIKIDVLAGVAEKETVKRNKKLWLRARLEQAPADGKVMNDKFRRKLERLERMGGTRPDESVDLRPCEELEVRYVEAEGKGYIQYVQGRLEDGDLAAVVPQIKGVEKEGATEAVEVAVDKAGENGNREQSNRTGVEPSLLGISIHSCGNLTHHAIRSLVINPAVRAIAIVGCCYNLATERLGPPDHKLPYLRPSLQPLNGRAIREAERFDPHGFPMSRRMCEYEWEHTTEESGGERVRQSGIRLNITARMMACQAMANWTEAESQGFFTRHFYRAVLQKMFLDRGVVTRVYHRRTTPDIETSSAAASSTENTNTPADASTSPVILGSLSKPCYRSFRAYVRGAVRKLTCGSAADPTPGTHAAVVAEKMGEDVLSDDEIDAAEARFAHRRAELSAAWSLMAFSAQVAEAVMVADRWQFLREQEGVSRCWVETVFEYGLSPRNLVVVGVKK